MVRKIHCYLSLTVAIVWLLQALTGITSVFHRELDAQGSADESLELDFDVLANKIDELRVARLPGRLSSIYATGGNPHHFDVFLHTPSDGLHVIRVDSAGRVLREQPWGIDFQGAGFLQSARLIHETLFLNDYGKLFVGLSGLLLLTNIVLGLKLAWPSARRWRSALFPKIQGNSAMRLRAWHRVLGLWFALPAIVLVTTGILLAWDSTVESMFGEASPEPEAYDTAPLSANSPGISLSAAIRTARSFYPEASLSIVGMPTQEHPWYKVHLLQGFELRRVFGKTAIYVAASDGKVLANYDAADASFGRKLLNSVFAIHTGEAGGLTGRLLALCVGLWLFLMIVLGLSYFVVRSRMQSSSKGIGR